MNKQTTYDFRILQRAHGSAFSQFVLDLDTLGADGYAVAATWTEGGAQYFLLQRSSQWPVVTGSDAPSLEEAYG